MSRGANLKGIPTAPEQMQPDSDTGEALVLPDKIGPENAVPVAPETVKVEDPATPADPSEGLDLPDKKPALEGVYSQVQSTDPDRAAKIIDLQKKLNQPAAFIDKNLDQVQKTADAPTTGFFKQLEDQYPGTAQFLMDPKNMAVTHDDLSNLPLTERLVQNVKSAFDFEKSALQSGSLQEELAFTRYQQMNGQSVGGSDMFRVGGSVAQQLGINETDPDKRAELISQKLQELEQNKPKDGFLKKGLYGASEFLPQILGGFGYGAKYAIPAAAGTAAMTAWSGPVAGLTAATAGAAGMTGGELEYNYKLMTGMSYDQLLKVRDVNGNPLPDSTAKIAATAMGAATAGLSLVKLTAVLDTIPGGKDFLSRFTSEAGEKVLSDPKSYGQALKGFAQNYVSSVAHGVGAMEGITAVNLAGTEAAKASTGQQFDHPSASDVLAEFGHTAEDAAATFGIMGLPGSALGLAHEIGQVQKVEKAKEFYTALGKTAEASKLRERMPEAHQEFIQNLTKGTPVENIYVPVEAAQSYFQGKNIDPDQAMSELGVTKAFEEAKATGGDVKIPLSTWTDKIVGTEHYQGLANDIKFDPEDLTANQVEAKRAEIQDQVQKLIAEQKEAEAQAGQKEATFQKIGQAGEIAKNIHEQLKAAGVSNAEAEFSPQLHEAFFNTLGQHLGMDPNELMERFPLKIGKGEEAEAGSQDVQTEAAPEAMAAQSAYKPEVLQQIRSDVEAGKVEKGRVTYDQEGNVTGRHGAVSTYPDYFQKKGYNKKETLKAIDKHLAGENPTEKQAKIVDDLYHASGYDKDAAKPTGPKEEPFLQAAQYEQGAPKLDAGPRGRIRIGREGYAIDLFRNADRSTFLHETGHYFLDVMGHIADDDKAPQQVKDDYQTILKWLGVESKDKIGTDQHEQFARGFEQYLMEGKAPNSSLQRAFDRFRKWLTSIYKQAKNLNVSLSDDVRGVMDRMLSSETEIERAQHAIGYTGEQIEGIPADVQAKIHDLQMRARDQAETSLLKEQMEETTEKRKDFLRSERERLTKVADDQVSELPLYKASDELAADIGRLKKSGEGDDAPVLSQKADTIAAKFLDEKLSDEDHGKFEAYAEMHGFADGEDLAHQILTAGERGLRKAEIDNRVEAGMAPHSDLMNSDAIRGEALKAIHNEKMTELLALERETLAGLVSKATIGAEVSKRKKLEAKIEAEAAKQQAREILSDKPIKEATKAGPYITAERNAAVKAAKALARGDYEKAAEAKRQQMLNHAIASEAMRAKVESDKALNFLKDYATRKNDLKDMPYAFVRQIDQLLSDHGLSEQRTEDFATQINIAKDLASHGEDPIEIANRTGFVQDANGNWKPESVSDFIERVNDNYYAISLPDSVMSGVTRQAEDLTLGELRDLKNSVKAISDVGKKYERFLGEFKTMDMKKAAADLRAEIEDVVGTPYADSMKIGSSHSSKWGEKVTNLLRLPDAVIPDMVNILTLCHYLDGGKEDGPAKEYIYRPLKHAEDRKLERYSKMTKEVNDLFSKFYEPKELSSYKEKREMQPALGRYMTKEEILAMALNMGNEGNLDRIRKGFGITDDQIKQVTKSLSKKDWDFCQSVWDHLDSYWPEIKELEMKISGVEPGRVESSPVETEHGTYPGGYYPIAYDFDKSSDAYKNAEQKNALYKQFSTAAAHTDAGHTESRVSNVTRPVRLSLDVLFNHLENVVHDLEFREPVIDANRFLNQRDVKSSITNAIGIKGFKSFDTWLKGVASDQGEYLSIGDKAFRWFRFNANFAQLGLSLKALVVHGPGNIANAMWEQGPTATISAFKDFIFGDGVHNTKEFVDEKSPRMSQRAKTRDRDMMDMNRQIVEGESKFRQLSNQFAFITYRMVDEGVAYPLWKSTYQRAIAEHDEQTAIDIADESVSRTLGSGSILDRVGAQQGSEFKKLTSMMFSWASMMFNRMWLSGKMAGLEYRKENTGAAVAILAKAAVYGWFAQAGAEALWQAASNNTHGGNSDDQKKKMLAELAKQPFAYLWIGRDIASPIIDRAFGEKQGSDYQLSPVETAVNTMIKPIGESAQIAFGHGHADQKFGEDLAKSASQIIGYPNQLNKMTFNFLDWAHNNGELTWKDLLSRRSKR